jgi:very-short-patch-repair endonuclease
MHPQGVFHRVKTGRLHPVWQGIRSRERAAIEVTIPPHLRRRRPGVTVYRRALGPAERTTKHGVAVTTVHRTLIDLAQTLTPDQLEATVNAADKYDLTNPESLRAALDNHSGRRGVVALRQVLDRRTFTLTDSHLERLFLPLARRAELPKPQTGRRLNGFRVDFYWPGLGLVVETDGLRYHRTPAQQSHDRLRDQAHTAAGLTTLRFTHAQVRYEPDHVLATLVAVAAHLRRDR